MNSESIIPGEGGSEAPGLASLLQRLENKPGFPALSESVAAINEITNSEDQNIEGLSAIILKDFGLTSSILRVANSASYRAASGSGITSVSRAVSVLGFSTLRDIALTVVLFDQIKNRAGAREIKESFLRAQMAGTIAREAGKLFLPRRAEEVYTCALFHSLGQILTLMYFPDEAQQIRDLINQHAHTENEAATKVLGIDFALLGQGVAEQWLFPSTMVHSLQPLPDGLIERPQTPEDMLWLLSGFGNEVCACLTGGASQQPGEGLSGLRQRFAEVMVFSGPQLHSMVEKSFEDTKAFASTLGVSLTQSSFVKQVTDWVKAGPDDEAGQSRLAPVAALDTTTSAVPPSATCKPRDDPHQVLSAGIDKLSDSIVGDFALNDILSVTVETMLRAMDFQRALICLRDDKSGFMLARMGCGKDANLVARKFRFPLKDTPNVFQLAIGNGLDIVIKDIADPKIADKIPSWYRSTVSARTFVLMPLMIKGQAVALIYCDKQEANSIVIPERELSLMKTLRNQALLAIKQSKVR